MIAAVLFEGEPPILLLMLCQKCAFPNQKMAVYWQQERHHDTVLAVESWMRQERKREMRLGQNSFPKLQTAAPVEMIGKRDGSNIISPTTKHACALGRGMCCSSKIRGGDLTESRTDSVGLGSDRSLLTRLIRFVNDVLVECVIEFGIAGTNPEIMSYELYRYSSVIVIS